MAIDPHNVAMASNARIDDAEKTLREAIQFRVLIAAENMSADLAASSDLAITLAIEHLVTVAMAVAVNASAPSEVGHA